MLKHALMYPVPGSTCNKCQNCPGLQLHHFRKSCTTCNCDFSEHDVSHDEILNTHKLKQMNIVDVNGNVLPSNRDYLWVPKGLDEDLIEAYMNSIPLEKVPHIENPDGIKYYNKQIIQQLPLQDSNIENAQTLSRKDKFHLDTFKRERDPQMLTGVVLQADQKLTCKGCNDVIYEDDVFVSGGGNETEMKMVWHPNCFVCCICEEHLVNLIYGHRNEEIFCTRHHAEQIKPRCLACDELIFCGEYIRTEDKAYHSQHFVCVACDKGLSGEQHLLDDGLPICIQCYDYKFANTCHMCGESIGVDEDDVMYENEHWHDYCLVCSLCKCKLSGTSFVVKDNEFLCSECFQKTDDKRCSICGEGFEPGTKRLELRGEYWHSTCFVCDICRDPITSKKFIHHDGKQVCLTCFDSNFAKRCGKCEGVLKEGGVSCAGSYFHRDCFACENCSTSIANQAFQQKDGKKFCTPCYKKLYAKLCKGCNDYIVNGEFYTVESDNWHKDCFKCISCGEILNQQSFVQENGKIKLMCEECL